jgi:hypothetical protein
MQTLACMLFADNLKDFLLIDFFSSIYLWPAIVDKKNALGDFFLGHVHLDQKQWCIMESDLIDLI